MLLQLARLNFTLEFNSSQKTRKKSQFFSVSVERIHVRQRQNPFERIETNERREKIAIISHNSFKSNAFPQSKETKSNFFGTRRQNVSSGKWVTKKKTHERTEFERLQFIRPVAQTLCFKLGSCQRRKTERTIVLKNWIKYFEWVYSSWAEMERKNRIERNSSLLELFICRK